jgi:hypothetical protein
MSGSACQRWACDAGSDTAYEVAISVVNGSP